MSPKQAKTRDIPVIGILLLFLGVVFLLQTFHVLPWGLWRVLWRFWPAILIIIGLGIVLRRYNTWLVIAVILAVQLASLGVAVWQYGREDAGNMVAASEPLGNLQRVEVQGRFDVGDLRVYSLPPGAPDLIRSESRTGRGGGNIRVELQKMNGAGKLFLSITRAGPRFPGRADRWDVGLSRDVSLAVDFRVAVTDTQLDMKDLKPGEVRLDADVSNIDMGMPSSGVTRATVRANVSNVSITVPEGVAVRIKVDANLSAVEVDGRRFPMQDGYYQSRDFDSTPNRVELDIRGNLSRVQVR